MYVCMYVCMYVYTKLRQRRPRPSHAAAATGRFFSFFFPLTLTCGSRLPLLPPQPQVVFTADRAVFADHACVSLVTQRSTLGKQPRKKK